MGANRCRCSSHTGQEAWHGSTSGPTYHNCKCETCRRGMADYMRNRYQTVPGHRAKVLARYQPHPRPRKPSPREIRHDMWAEQNGICALCHKPLPFEESELDHDHSCCSRIATACGNCFRGVLHGRCNSMIGFAGDDPTLLMQGAEYLGGF
jgi:hypothetical protein